MGTYTRWWEINRWEYTNIRNKAYEYNTFTWTYLLQCISLSLVLILIIQKLWLTFVGYILVFAHMQSHKTIDVVFLYSHCALDMFHHWSVWKFATQPIKTSTICRRVWFKHFLHNSFHNCNGNSIKPWADRIFNRIHYMLTPFSTYCLHMIHKMHFTSTISTNNRKYQHHSPTVHVAEL